ncbi:MAG: hypothetical protein ACYCXB_10245 [Candidatus Humimicrobiaceae bacterium]
MIVIFSEVVFTSCCFDPGSLLKSESTVITFTGDGSSPPMLEDQFDKYKDLLDSSNKQYKDIDYTAIKKELAHSSDYPISIEEENKFFKNLEEIYSEEKFTKVKDYLKNFKNLYPSGYFTLIKVTQKQDTDNYELFKLMEESKDKLPSEIRELLTADFSTDYSEDLNTVIHELTHIGPMAFFDKLAEKNFLGKLGSAYYMTGNVIIFISKDKMLFSKTEILQDISNPSDFDFLYLDPSKSGNNVDFINILDEINAYTVSVKCNIAAEELIGNTSHTTRYGLLKQMSHFEIYLNRCYTKYPEDWKYITDNKGLAFLIMKLWTEAEKFEIIIKDDSRFNLDSEPVYEFVYSPDNHEIINKYFNDSGILSYKDKTFQDAEKELKNIRIYDINS